MCCKNFHYILLFLYDKGSYKLTASGAILEAIWNQKPIIALHNYYFDYIFEKFGDLGFLCDSIDELVNKINEIALDREILTHFSENLKNAKEALLPQNVKKQLFIKHKNFQLNYVILFCYHRIRVV